MKKIRLFLLSTIVLLAWSGAKGQTSYVSENFATASDSTPPTGWVQNQITGAYYDDWRFDNPAGRTLNSPISSPAAIFDSDYYSSGGGSEDVALESPSFSVNAGATVMFEFDHYFLGGFGGEGFVEVYDGSSWVAIDSFDATTSNPQTESYDISSLVSGVSTAQIRFRWTGDYSYYWIVDNVEVFSPAPYDVGATRLTSISSGCLSSNESVSIRVRNYGTTSLDTIPVAYQINSGTIVRDTIFGTLSVSSSTAFTFSGTADLSTVGTYTIKVFTELGNDVNSLNDTLTTVIINSGVVTGFPYSIDWESGTGNWFTESLNGTDIWELGLPNQTNIDAANSGTNAWMTDLDNDYPNEVDITLNSPCFDLSTITVPVVSFWLRLSSEENWDGMVLERSLDGGNSWIRVDSANSSIYNNTNSNLILGPPMWSGDVAWSQYSIIDAVAGGEPSVRYRFRFASDEFVTEEGVAVDDFSISSVQTDIGVAFSDLQNHGIYCGLSSAESVDIVIINNGDTLASGDTIFVDYTINSASARDTLILSGNFNSEDSIIYTLGQLFDLTGLSSTLSIDVTIAGDQFSGNNSATVSINNSATTISSFPWTENFDSYSTGTSSTFGPWINVAYDDQDWTIHSGTTTSTNTGPSGDNTSGAGNYIYTEASSSGSPDKAFILALPCLDFSGLTQPHIMYWYHMYGGDMGNLYVEVFNGTDWAVVDSIMGEQQTSVNDAWERQLVDLSAFANQVVSLRLRGITGSSFDSDISIDDIEIFDLFDLDASIAAHVSDPFCPGVNDVKVTVANRGTDTLFNVTINWEVNGVAQTPVTFTDTLLFLETSAPVTLGSYSFTSGVTYDLKFYTSDPNSLTDANMANDTLVQNGYQLAMSGAYTIGGTSPDYSSFTDAINDLLIYGVCGSITFNVAPGTYNEQLTIPVITGASAGNTIEFIGADTSSTILTFSSSTSAARHTILFDGAEFVSFRNMTIEATGTYGWVIHMMNGANNLELTGNQILTSVSTSTFFAGIIASGSATGATTAGNSAHNVIIKDNYVHGGYYGISMVGATGNTLQGLVIDSNRIVNSYFYGIYFNNTDMPVVQNNLIDVNPTGSTGSYGLRIGTSTGPFTITGNTIRNMGYYGIYIDGVPASASNRSLIANNFVGGGFSNTGTLGGGIRILGASTSYIDILHNSINVDAGGMAGLNVRISTVSNLRVLNNVFAYTGSAAGYAMYITSAGSIDSIDFNNYYSAGSNFVYYNGSARSDLSALQGVNAPTNNDVNSVSIDPAFYSDFDLRTKSVTMNNLGTFVGITIDIDGNTRSTSTPDIGGFEYTPPADDVRMLEVRLPGGCGDSNAVVEVVVQNLGTNNQSSIPVAVILSGDITDTLSQTFTTSLGNGDIDTFAFSSTINTYGGVDLILKAYTHLSGDEDTNNDTVHVNIMKSTLDTFPWRENFDSYSSGAGNFGFLTNVSYDDLDWEVNSGTTTSANTGPAGDNTTGSGNYIYTESSTPGFPSKTFILELSCVNFAGIDYPGLSFWYHMHGQTMGNLYVDVDDGSGWSIIDSIIGEQQLATTDPWKQKVVNLAAYANSGVSIRLRGVTGSNFYSDMAIDDIEIFEYPENEIGVVEIISPTAGCGDSTTVVEVVVKNYGVNTQSTIPVKVNVSGDINTTLSQSFSASMGGGDIDTFTFTTTLNTYSGANFTLTAFTELSGDENLDNDTAMATVSIEGIPAAPSVTTPAAVCGASSFTINASASGGNTVAWYSSATSTTILDEGNTFATPVVSQSTTFYAEAYGLSTNSITTTFNDNNGCGSGNMFDVTAKSNIIIDSFAVNFASSSSGHVRVYYKSGSYSGNENDSTAWTYLGTGNSTPNTSGTPTNVSVGQSLNIPAGQTYGIYVMYDARYTNLSTTYSNSDLDIETGAGHCSAFSTGIAGRTFNGTLFYRVKGCTSPRTPVTVTVNPAPTGTDFTAGSVFQGVQGNGTSSNPDSVCVGDTLTYELIPPSGYSNADLGTDWDVASISFVRNFVTGPVDTTIINPTLTTNAMIQFVPDATEAGSVFKVDVVVAMSNGCDTTLTNYIYVGAEPIADFSVSDGCNGNPVNFTNNSTNGTSYHWDFGDFSQPSTSANPSRTYQSTGTYTVTLTVTNGSCSDVIQKSVTIYDNPTADFAAMNVCGGTSVSFMDSSDAGSGSISSYSWDFGDNNLSLQQNPSHQYAVPGTYQVVLTVTNSNGCTDMISKNVTVFESPEADFVTANTCHGDTMMFTNTSTIGAGSLSYMWYFGDGDTSTAENPMHAYSAPGFYSVKLVASTSDGCMDSTTQIVEVYPQPQVNFTVSDVCDGETVAFNNTSFIAGGTIDTYEWDFGDTNMSTSANPTHMYASPGTYMVTLTATSNNGCVAEMTTSVTVNPMPVADLMVRDACLGENVMFSNMSSVSAGTVSYMWNFGDGGTSTDTVPVYAYTTAGTYVVALTVTTDNGCEATAYDTVEIFPAPETMFTATDVCVGEVTEFNNTTTVASGTVTYMWHFGDGDTSTMENPTHLYTDAGVYDVTLMATTDNGCMDSMVMQVEVYDLPNSGWTQIHNPMGEVAFTANEQNANNYVWHFGDGDSSLVVNPVHVYDSNGTYTVTLWVNTANGCSTTTTDTIQIINTSIEGDVDAPAIRFEVYPNPFNINTNLVYELPKASNVTLEVFDLNGKRVSRLVNTRQPAGEHLVPLTAEEHGLSQGVYMVRLTVDGHSYIKRIVQVK